jgi:hypothetical protein
MTDNVVNLSADDRAKAAALREKVVTGERVAALLADPEWLKTRERVEKRLWSKFLATDAGTPEGLERLRVVRLEAGLFHELVRDIERPVAEGKKAGTLLGNLLEMAKRSVRRRRAA